MSEQGSPEPDMTHTILSKYAHSIKKSLRGQPARIFPLMTCPHLQARAPGLLGRSSQAQVRT